jgi:hypothetical protein
MTFPIAGGTQSTGYDIDNSIRLNDDDSHNISNNPGGGSGSDGSRTQFSISMWVKRSTLALGDNSKQQFLTSAVATNNFYGTIKFNGDDKIAINLINSGSDQDEIHTDAFFRDTSAWYHLFFAFDKTQASLADGVKLYVNGILQTFGTTTYTQNQGYHFFRPGKSHYIGNYNGSEGYFDGYMAEVHFVDGQVKAHTDFGEFNDDGVWVPIQYTGSHGTYGFHLEFKQTGTSENSSGIGADTSGNDEHFAVANLGARNVVQDTPTNNFMTFNSLYTNSRGTFAEGNCQVTTNVQGSVPYGQVEFGNFHVNSGKWYWEVEVVQVGSGGSLGLGANERAYEGTYINGHNNGGSAGNIRYNHSNGNVNNGSSTAVSGAATYTDDDTIGFAMDLDNNKMYIHKNGTYINSGDPAAGSNGITMTSSYSDFWTPWISKDDTTNNAKVYLNTGNPVIANDSGNADDNGYGDFEYDVPAGFYALCTKNLATYG